MHATPQYGSLTDLLLAGYERRGRDFHLFEAVLDRLTRPVGCVPKAGALTRLPGYRLRGTTMKARSQIELYCAFMRNLFELFPDQRDNIAQVLAADTRCRVFVAQSARALFPHKPASWAFEHSRTLVPGWYIDTNLKLSDKQRNVARATGVLGLTAPHDFTIDWGGQ